MEKAGALIERLLEQYNNNASAEQLRITAQLLLVELENKKEVKPVQDAVAVFFPAASNFNIITENGRVQEEEAPKQNSAVINNTPEKETPAPAVVEAVPEKTEATQKPEPVLAFDPMVEIPTLALKQQEINEANAARHESVNDKLRAFASGKDLGSNLKQGPIKDLRKAIGINDQYVFINDLFRGDQTMYERSIKTINGFNIYGEAELWIKRELKLKLGWNEQSEIVKHFDQLVSRRFS